MNLFAMARAAISAGLLLFGVIQASQAAFWAPSNGAGSCHHVCKNNNSNAISSGKFINGANFYICSGNAKGAGFRGGYNLEPKWSNACVVGWGGKELFVRNYTCLCE